MNVFMNATQFANFQAGVGLCHIAFAVEIRKFAFLPSRLSSRTSDLRRT